MIMKGLYDVFSEHGIASTDTRNIVPGAIFFALRGPTFNGNAYAKAALEKGALLAVVDDPGLEDVPGMHLVPNVLETLQALAAHHRNCMPATVIGLTGSNGKTTTKELMHSVLRQHAPTLATEGNLNNHIGVPLTLLKLNVSHQFAVIEMGANGIGQIEELSAITKPDYGYITNYGKAHLEGFGSIEGVEQGKSELFERLRASNGMALINIKDEKQVRRSEGIKRITFGSKEADVLLETGLTNDGFVYVDVQRKRMISQLTGAYNATNAAAAVALGVALDLPLSCIAQGIAEYVPSNNRSQWWVKDNCRVLLDAYNANPDSVEAALQSFSKQNGTKWVVLGDMLELGGFAIQEHRRMAELAKLLSFDRIILVGSIYASANNMPAGVEVYSSTEKAMPALEKHPENLAVLLKGSRGMKMESLLSCFEK